jgi:Family of unknown function (DUF6148)
VAGITLAQAEAQLTAWLAASTAVSQGQAYTIGTRSLSRANSREILQQIQFWDGQVKRLADSPGGGIRVRGITPV